MMGTGTFAEPTFLKLLESFPGEVVGLVTQPDRDVGRRSGSSRQTGVGMAVIAKSHAIPVLQPASINSDEGVAMLAALEPDLCVVAAYGQIFKAAALAVPKLGFINVHASLLPKYRGAAPVAHAILNGKTETGVTIFRITTGIDTGEMLAKAHVKIEDYETTGKLEIRLSTIGAELIDDVIHKLQQGVVFGENQDTSQASLAPKITKEMGLIDWSRKTTEVLCQIRAMQPWPTAYTFLHRPGKDPMRIIIHWGLDIFEPSDRSPGYPGRVKEYPLMIRTADGMIGIYLIQPAGKKMMGSRDFIQGYPMVEGSFFGPEHLS